MDNKKNVLNNITERELRPASGILMLFLNIIAMGIEIVVFFGGAALTSQGDIFALAGVVLILLAIVFFVISCILFGGLKTVKPNEALVLTLFGKYHGTIKKSGFFLVNPFATAFNPGYSSVRQPNGTTITYGSKTVSLKVRTLDNERQKVNDILGNPIIIGAVVIWRVVDPTKAVFAVDNYINYLSIQCDSTIRNIARLYPYDDMDDKDGIDEKTLRGSSQEIADRMKDELQTRVAPAGLEIMEVRITHLSYSEEIAAAMLQRQQAAAVVDARKLIVDGAVGMVELALERLNEKELVELDEERKAAMVSNLLVVLCGNKDAQPVVNSGSLY